jgi:hypothetical protein
VLTGPSSDGLDVFHSAVDAVLGSGGHLPERRIPSKMW